MDQMIALVQQPATFVGNDSGPMHLSAASGNRVLAIFGPTSPQRFGPYPITHPKHQAVEAPAGRLADLGTDSRAGGIAGAGLRVPSDGVQRPVNPAGTGIVELHSRLRSKNFV